MGIADFFQNADSSLTSLVAWLVALAIVWGFSSQYFDGTEIHLDPQQDGADAPLRFPPAFPKDLISRTQYWYWKSFFFLSMLIIFFLIHQIIPALSSSQLQDFTDMERAVLSAYPQILSALVLSGVIPILPDKYLPTEWLRKVAHKRASIPDRAIAMYTAMQNEALIVEKARAHELVKVYGRQAIAVEDFSSREELQRKWANIMQIQDKLRDAHFVNAGIWTAQLNRRGGGIETLRRRFDQLVADVVKFRAGALDDNHIDRLRDDISMLLKGLARYTVCLVFSTTQTDDQADSKFRELGVRVERPINFKINPGAVFLSSIVAAVLIGVLTFGLVATMSIFTRNAAGDTNPMLGGAYATAAVMIYFAPLLVFILLGKALLGDLWPVRGIFHPPGHSALLVCLIVGGAWGLAAMRILALLGILPPKLNDTAVQWDWFSLLGAATAFLIAWCVDKKPAVRKYSRTVFHTAARAGAGFLTAGIVGTAAASLSLNMTLGTMKGTDGQLMLLFFFLISSGIGLAFAVVAFRFASNAVDFPTGRDRFTRTLNQSVLPFLKAGHPEELKPRMQLWDAFNKDLVVSRGKIPQIRIARLEELLVHYEIVDVNLALTDFGSGFLTDNIRRLLAA